MLNRILPITRLIIFQSTNQQLVTNFHGPLTIAHSSGLWMRLWFLIFVFMEGMALTSGLKVTSPCVLGLTQDYKNPSQVISTPVNLDGNVFICIIQNNSLQPASPGNLLEMQKKPPKAHPRPAEHILCGQRPVLCSQKPSWWLRSSLKLENYWLRESGSLGHLRADSEEFSSVWR